MANDKDSFSLASVEAMTLRVSINEAQDDIKEFNATKKTVLDLLSYKRTLIELGEEDYDKSNEVKSRAIDAINNLFNDIIRTGKNT